MGGKSAKGREEQARKLLTWGLRDFTTVHLFSAGQSLGEEPVWYGADHRLPVGSAQNQSLSLPKNEADKLKAQYVINTARLEAPIGKGQTVGEIRISDNGQVVKTLPLVALQAVPQGGVFSRLADYVKLKL